jgi:hypothetical protein
MNVRPRPLLSRNYTGPRPLAALGLIALVAIGWGSVVLGGFQYDDYPNLLNAPATTGDGELAARLASGFRSLTRLTYPIDFASWASGQADGWDSICGARGLRWAA